MRRSFRPRNFCTTTYKASTWVRRQTAQIARKTLAWTTFQDTCGRPTKGSRSPALTARKNSRWATWAGTSDRFTTMRAQSARIVEKRSQSLTWTSTSRASTRNWRKPVTSAMRRSPTPPSRCTKEKFTTLASPSMMSHPGVLISNWGKGNQVN